MILRLLRGGRNASTAATGAIRRGSESGSNRSRGRAEYGAFNPHGGDGVGGSAGVGILLVASIESTVLAVATLPLIAIFTAVSMTALSSGFGRTLVIRPVTSPFATAAPVLGTGSLAFGVWYASSAWSLTPYPL
jgi:hypothetical protein